jgi:hypothetical protein
MLIFFGVFRSDLCHSSKTMHYCDQDDSEIFTDLENDSIPDDALVNACCWKKICQVRGRNPKAIDVESWTEVSRRRGYVQNRQNPRGF